MEHLQSEEPFSSDSYFSTISTSTNFIAIGIKLVLVRDPLYWYVVKLVLVEIGYVALTSTNFAYYDFFKIPKIVLSEDPL